MPFKYLNIFLIFTVLALFWPPVTAQAQNNPAEICPIASEFSDAKIDIMKKRHRQRLQEIPTVEELTKETESCLGFFGEEIIKFLQSLPNMDLSQIFYPGTPDFQKLLSLLCALAKERISEEFSEHFFKISDVANTVLSNLYGVSIQNNTLTIDLGSLVSQATGLSIPFSGTTHSYTLWERTKEDKEEDKFLEEWREWYENFVAVKEEDDGDEFIGDPFLPDNQEHTVTPVNRSSEFNNVVNYGPPTPKAAPYWDWIVKYSEMYDIDPYYLAAMAQVESGWDPLAVSRVGARGLIQIMPGTIDWANCPNKNMFDPEANIHCSAKFLRTRVLNYKPINAANDPAKAAAAYNWGPGHDCLKRADWRSCLPGEPRNHHIKVMAEYSKFTANAAKSGLVKKSEVSGQ